MSIIAEVAERSGISEKQAACACDAFLEQLHRRLVEYRGLNGDYLGEEAHYELSDRGYYHLLGLLEQFSKRYTWDEGSSSEYLGRLPPIDRWKALAQETAGWKWRER